MDPNDPNYNLVVHLGIKYDCPRGVDNLFHWSSRMKFSGLQNGDVWRDVCGEDEGQLARIAKDGYYQMMQSILAEGIPPKRRPKVMTILAVGHEVYLSSSVKGTGLFWLHAKDERNPIYQELRACQLILEKQIEDRAFEGEGPNHTNHLRGAMCGEIFALYAYFTAYKDDLEAAKAKLRGSRIVAVEHHQTWHVGNRDTLLPYHEIKRVDPCGTQEALEQKQNPSVLKIAWKDLAQFPALTALPNGDVPIAMKEQMEFSDVVYDQFCWETDYVPVACDMFAAVQSNNV